jgi:hypothetical protein
MYNRAEIAIAAGLQTVSNQMKAYVEVELHFHTFLTSASDAGEWPASRLGRFLSAGKFHSIQYMGAGFDQLDQIIGHWVFIPYLTKDADLYTGVIRIAGL